MNEPLPTAPALQRGLRVLELLSGAKEPLTLSTIAHMLALPVSSIQRMVNQLLDEDYIIRTASGGYYLGNKLYRIAYNQNADETLLNVALPAMRDFVFQTSQSIHLNVAVIDQFVIIGQLAGTDLVRVTVRPGSYPIAEFPSGQVLLVFGANGADETELKKVAPELQKSIREKGYCVGESHTAKGVFHLSVPIILENNQCVASLATSFCLSKKKKPDEKQRFETLVEPLKSVAAEISRLIG